MASVGDITVVSVTGVGTSDPVMIDISRNPINIAILVTVSGTVTYTVEHTYDDPLFYAFAPIGTSIEPDSFNPPVWYPDVILANKSATAEGSITLPYLAFRLNVTAGSGTATMQAIQAGFRGA